jgi:hypothetical protein
MSDRKSENTISGELHYLKNNRNIIVTIMNLKRTIEQWKASEPVMWDPFPVLPR